MKIFRNRFVVGLFCFGVAAVLAFVVLPNILDAKESTVNVVRAARNISAGVQITDRDIEIVEVGAYNLPSDTIYDQTLVVGMYASTSITQGDIFFDSKVTDIRFSTLLEQAEHDNMRLLTITLDNIATGVGGHLQAGDIVNVRYFMPEQTEYEYDYELEMEVTIDIPSRIVDDPLLERIAIYALENINAEAITSDKYDDARVSDRLIPKTATLIVTEEQAQAILYAEYMGRIHLVFVSRGGV
jgi:pilus assembly protein CpaB